MSILDWKNDVEDVPTIKYLMVRMDDTLFILHQKLFINREFS